MAASSISLEGFWEDSSNLNILLVNNLCLVSLLVFGPKEIEVISKNRFDKNIKKLISVIVEDNAINTKQELVFEVEALEDIVIGVSLDDSPKDIFSLKLGEKKHFTARDKILFSTDNAGQTLVKFNGKNMGNLGKNNESIVDMQFFAENLQQKSQ